MKRKFVMLVVGRAVLAAAAAAQTGARPDLPSDVRAKASNDGAFARRAQPTSYGSVAMGDGYVITVSGAGGLRRFSAANDVTVFPKNDSYAESNGVVTLDGVVVFTMQGVEKTERGTIRLTRAEY
ncbi:MAG: hypothetical protein ACFB00_10950 [Parvularculaceae bacterium]